MDNIKLKSTYGLRKNTSFLHEKFYNIPLTWRLGVCNIEIVKIRIAEWNPKSDRSNQAIFYFDVKSREEAEKILKSIKDVNFKCIESWFENKYTKDNPGYRTGILHDWLNSNVIPQAREKFKGLLTKIQQDG